MKGTGQAANLEQNIHLRCDYSQTYRKSYRNIAV
jgi:hypothetical protein